MIHIHTQSGCQYQETAALFILRVGRSVSPKDRIKPTFKIKYL